MLDNEENIEDFRTIYALTADKEDTFNVVLAMCGVKPYKPVKIFNYLDDALPYESEEYQGYDTLYKIENRRLFIDSWGEQGYKRYPLNK